MTVLRKDAQQLEHRGPPIRPENGVVPSVDPGISASQMVPILLDYYTVHCYRAFTKSLNSWVKPDFVDGTGWLLRVRSSRDAEILI
jgi:hypothetical protein